VKVCPHCTEELPDEATVCPVCHKDPAARPAWAVAKRPDEAPSQWPEDAQGPNPDPDLLERIQRLEDATRERPIPQIVWVSLALSYSWLFVGLLGFLLHGIAGLILVLVGLHITGLVLGIVARHQIEASNGRLGGMMWANIAIALNLIRLVLYVFSGQVLPAMLSR
jgi:hypothetical protein